MLYLNNNVLEIKSSYEVHLSSDRIVISGQFDLIQIGDEYGFVDPDEGAIFRDSIEGVIGSALIMGHTVTMNGEEITPSKGLLDWWGDIYKGVK